MLYTTTRDPRDVFTPQRVLSQKRGPDGGLFVPYWLPVLSDTDIRESGQERFNACVAEITNRLFGTRLSAYDLDLALGRQPVRLRQLGQKVIIAECWHNTDRRFSRLVEDLAALVQKDKQQPLCVDGWASIGVRMAVLCGIFSELVRAEVVSPEETMDISMVSGDFSAPMSAWYVRSMGLPVGNIVCCCNDNSSLWNFVCHGQLRTDGVALPSVVPEADVAVPEGLERLIHAVGGADLVKGYVQALHRGESYYLENFYLQKLRQGLYVTVSSEKRILNTIPNVFATHGYIPGPGCALAYAGLQDFRSRREQTRTALVLAENSPACDGPVVARALGITPEELAQYLKMPRFLQK